ncbi:uncharacterized protein G2W53_004295 [Senna tora]|uniref:Uncharacterized protein n=1 Tax=Senna tora TaxID=362788 RepID=A0A835CK23_9FABA|nr:uncharacterized protein G2W53_004295 [Senna tora]
MKKKKQSRFHLRHHLRPPPYCHHRCPVNTACSGSSQCDSEKTLDPFLTTTHVL